MNNNSDLPTFEDRSAMWNDVDFPPHVGTHPHTNRFVDALRTRLGKVFAHSFILPIHPVLEWYLQRNQLHECNFFERFWLAPTPAKTIPHKLSPLNYYDKSIFESTTTFHLNGMLSTALFTGGAYSNYKGFGLEAHHLGEAAETELIAGDYEETLCYFTHQAWSEFFYGVFWDFTSIVVSKQQRVIHIILATDVD